MDKIEPDPVQPVMQFNFKFVLNFENCVFRNSGGLLYFLQ